MRSQGTPLLWNCEREKDTENHSLSGAEVYSWSLYFVGHLTKTDEFWRFSVIITLSWVLPPGALPDSQGVDWRKIPLNFPKGEDKVTIFQEKLSPEPNQLGLWHNPANVGKGKCQTPSPVSLPVSPMGGGDLRSTCEGHSPGLTNRLRSNHNTVEDLPSPTPHHPHW